MITGRKDLLTNGSALVLLGAALLAGGLLGLAPGGPLALPMIAVAAVWAGAAMLLYGGRAYPAPAAAAHPAWPAARGGPVPS